MPCLLVAAFLPWWSMGVEYEGKNINRIDRELTKAMEADPHLPLEAADAIKVNNRVKAHYTACCAGGEPSLDEWKKELKEL